MEIYSPEGKSYVHIAKIAKKEIEKIGIEVGNQPRETLKSFYKRCINEKNHRCPYGTYGMPFNGIGSKKRQQVCPWS